MLWWVTAVEPSGIGVEARSTETLSRRSLRSTADLLVANQGSWTVNHDK